METDQSYKRLLSFMGDLKPDVSRDDAITLLQLWFDLHRNVEPDTNLLAPEAARLKKAATSISEARCALTGLNKNERGWLLTALSIESGNEGATELPYDAAEHLNEFLAACEKFERAALARVDYPKKEKSDRVRGAHNKSAVRRLMDIYEWATGRSANRPVYFVWKDGNDEFYQFGRECWADLLGDEKAPGFEHAWIGATAEKKDIDNLDRWLVWAIEYREIGPKPDLLD